MKHPLRRWIGHQAARLGFWRLKLLYGEHDISNPGPEIRTGVDAEVRAATAVDLTAIEATLPAPELRAFQMTRASGAIGFVAWVGTRPAGYSWLMLDAVKIGRWPVQKLPADYGYQCDSLVFPEFRGNKLFQKISSTMDDYLRAQGKRYACNLVAPDNEASIAARKKLGATFRPVTILKFPFCRPFVAHGHIP